MSLNSKWTEGWTMDMSHHGKDSCISLTSNDESLSELLETTVITDNDADVTFLRRETRSLGQAGLYWTLMVLKS